MFIIVACLHPLSSCGMHMGNKEEIAFNYMEVLAYCSLFSSKKGPTKIPLVKALRMETRSLLIQNQGKCL